MKFQVKRKGLFSIGELATVFHVTPGTIRHYESLDLLKPSFVDPETNYRFYEFSRLEVLHTIRYLRSLGMTLEAIGEFLRDRNVSGILELLEAQNAPLSAVYFCPHHPTHAFAPYLKDCDCRKPNPGMLLQAARDLNIDLTQSVLIGDKTSDIQAAKAAGLSKAVLVQSDGTKPWTECAVPHLQTKDLLAAAKLL